MTRRQLLGRLFGASVIASTGVTTEHVSAKSVAADRYMLPLTRESAQALANVISRVAGDPVKSQRRFIDKIYHQLGREGFTYQWGNVLHGRSEGLGGITFVNDADIRDCYPIGPNRATKKQHKLFWDTDGNPIPDAPWPWHADSDSIRDILRKAEE